SRLDGRRPRSAYAARIESAVDDRHRRGGPTPSLSSRHALRSSSADAGRRTPGADARSVADAPAATTGTPTAAHAGSGISAPRRAGDGWGQGAVAGLVRKAPVSMSEGRQHE